MKSIRPLACILMLSLLAGCERPSQPTPPSQAESPKPAEAVSTPTPTPTPEPWVAVPIPNAGFEEGEEGWDFSSAGGIAQVVKEAANSGEFGLRLESDKNVAGLFVAGSRVPVERGMLYRLSLKGRVVRGSAGGEARLRFLDANGKELLSEGVWISNESGGAWAPSKGDGIPPADAAFVDITIQPSFRTVPSTVDIDDLVLEALPLVAEAPWPGTYKLRPDEKQRLTAADVVGPDGLVYPDWTWAGVPGGIPAPPVALRLEDLGAVPEQDISGLLEQAAKDVAASGGGVIELGEGTFFLDQPVVIYGNNVVIRGAGSGKTLLLFRYNVPPGEILFFRIQPGQEIGPDDSIDFHANPRNLVALEVMSGNKSLIRRARQDHWGNTFGLVIKGGPAMQALGEGNHTFTAIAEYADGTRVEKNIDLCLVPRKGSEPSIPQLAAITFVGRGNVSNKILLREDARRGSRTLVLAPGHNLKTGNRISLVAPASDRWKKLVGHGSPWPNQAQTITEVEAVEGDRVTLLQPVRTDFLVEDGSFVQKQQLLSGCGVESLSLEQQVVPNQGKIGPAIGTHFKYSVEDLWISGITFNKSWGCWLKDVKITNAGRNAVYFPLSAHIEVRDSAFINSLFKHDGGTGYIGFDTTYDSLMDNIEVRSMRHAPNIQWNASGNVIRNSRFIKSDGQWHAGFTMENLYENNVIDAAWGNGSYGHGLYASGPSSGIHGPQGPRNVVYNNDIISPLDSLFMRGGNEGWLILHNRFVCDKGRAIFAREKSFDHIIKGNVFVMRKSVLPPVYLGVDSTGVEIIDNAFYGATPPMVGFAGGITKLAVDEGNTLTPEVPDPLPERPQPAVPSIYEWQREHVAGIRAASLAREAAKSAP